MIEERQITAISEEIIIASTTIFYVFSVGLRSFWGDDIMK